MRKSSFVLVLGRRNLLVFLILQQSRVTLKYCQLRSTTKKKQFFPASAFFGVCLNLFCKGRKNKTKRLKTHRSILVHNNCDLCKTEYCPMFHSSVRPTRAFIIRLILLKKLIIVILLTSSVRIFKFGLIDGRVIHSVVASSA